MQPLGLPVRPARTADVGPLVPVEAEPAQIAQDRRLGLARRALDVGVLDAQDERAARAARQQPVEQRRARVADVELAGGAGCEADTHTQVRSSKCSQSNVLVRRSRSSHQRDGVRGDGFAAAELADALVGLPLDADAVDRRCQSARARLRAHGVDVRRELRALGDDGHVDVADFEAPALGRSSTARASRSRLEASFHRGSVSGKCRPISPAPAAPRMASVTAWQTTSASECPRQAAVERNRDAAENQRPPCHQPMQIVAGAGAAGPRRRRSPSIASAIGSILRRRDLDVRRLALDEPDRMAGRSASDASSVASASVSASASRSTAPERLRRLREKDRLAIERRPRPPRRRPRRERPA